MRETNCQEVKKPADRDHVKGMEGRGLGMACEKSRGGGGTKMENICSLYLLRSRMHDHNPLTLPPAFCTSLCRYVAPPPSLALLIVLLRFCYITPRCGWHSDNCLYPLGWGSGCDRMSYTTSPYVGFSEDIHSHSPR